MCAVATPNPNTWKTPESPKSKAIGNIKCGFGKEGTKI